MKELKTKEEFDATLAEAGGKLVVVDFGSTWCVPCQKIAPYFASLAEEHPDAIFVKVDADENEETYLACGGKQLPTFQFYKNGQKLGDDLLGANEALLKQRVLEHK